MYRQTRITPCRDRISDRFPIASFAVSVPHDRFFEVACATDPRLFHPDRVHERTDRNFLSSRHGGLLRAPAGEATYLVPPNQLKQFAGATRLFYALGTYGGLRGEDPYFTIEADNPSQVPSIQIAQDFTGRTLDRSRFGRREPADARYGGPATTLTWGGDAALGSRRNAGAAPARRLGNAEPEYDDGYDKALWTRPLGDETRTAVPGSDASVPAEDGASQLGSTARADLADEFEDGYSLQAAEAGRNPYPSDLTPDGGVPAVASQAARYAGRGAVASAATIGYEDAPDLARHRAAASPVRYGGSAVTERPARRAPMPAASRGFSRVASEAPIAGPAPGAPFESGSTLPGRSVDYADVWAAEPELPVEALRAAVLSAPQLLAPVDRLHLIDLVARFEGGAAGYSAVSADGEFQSPGLPQYQTTHVGLSWGFVQFAQRYGALGEVLLACSRRDAAEFTRTFGDAAEQLTRVTTAPTEEGRLAPVANAVLWEQPWLARFERAGSIPAFQAAQREVADTYFLVPNLPIAAWLGFNTDRALAMLFDRLVHMGRAGGVRWIVNTVGPIRSQKQRAAALAALGFSDLASFASSVGGDLERLGAGGAWSAPVHAALVGALRGLGASSPIVIPSLNDMLDALVQTASDNAKGGDRSWTTTASRLSTLRTSTELLDTPYQL